MQRLSTRSAKWQKVIHAQSTLIEVYLTTLCLLITYYIVLAVEAVIFTQYVLLTSFSKLLRLTFLMHYTLITYFSKQLKLRFLTHYILLTFFSKLLRQIF